MFQRKNEIFYSIILILFINISKYFYLEQIEIFINRIRSSRRKNHSKKNHSFNYYNILNLFLKFNKSYIFEKIFRKNSKLQLNELINSINKLFNICYLILMKITNLLICIIKYLYYYYYMFSMIIIIFILNIYFECHSNLHRNFQLRNRRFHKQLVFQFIIFQNIYLILNL